MDQIYFVLFLTVAFLAAGTIKGAAGLGLPTTALGIMTLSIAPRTAIALLMLPLILTNAWQVYRSGEIRAAVKHYMPLIVALLVMVWATVNLTSSANDTVLLTFLGVSILLFVAVNVTKYAPFIPERYDLIAQLIAGVTAGVMGGLTSVWAPPMAMYLAARRIPKEGFVRASGLIFFLGSLPLAAGYVRQGFMTPQLTMMSAYLLIPTFVGFWVGEKLRHRMSEDVFRKFVLGVFFVMGLNLIRRAYFS
jgi:uncharacterized membrane protein YfcA